MGRSDDILLGLPSAEEGGQKKQQRSENDSRNLCANSCVFDLCFGFQHVRLEGLGIRNRSICLEVTLHIRICGIPPGGMSLDVIG